MESVPPELLAGPYGFLIVIFGCVLYSVREWRKGREYDVEKWKGKYAEAVAETDRVERDSESEEARLKAQIEALQQDLSDTRLQHYKIVEDLNSERHAMRLKLLAAGFDPEDS